jgi:hypothetical protein
VGNMAHRQTLASETLRQSHGEWEYRVHRATDREVPPAGAAGPASKSLFTISSKRDVISGRQRIKPLQGSAKEIPPTLIGRCSMSCRAHAAASKTASSTFMPHFRSMSAATALNILTRHRLAGTMMMTFSPRYPAQWLPAA